MAFLPFKTAQRERIAASAVLPELGLRMRVTLSDTLSELPPESVRPAPSPPQRPGLYSNITPSECENVLQHK